MTSILRQTVLAALLSLTVFSSYLTHAHANSTSISTTTAIATPLTLNAIQAGFEQYNPTVLSAAETLDLQGLMQRLASKQVVLVGEVHDRYEHHLNQLAVLKAMHAQNPQLAIGVEWFQQPFQAVLDAYIAGQLTEAELLEQTDYYQRWRYDYRLFRPIIEYAKAQQIPLLALNASNEITRKIARSGLASLNAAERAQIPDIIHPPNALYQQRLTEAFAQHSHHGQLENFITVQRVWDETMTANIKYFLAQYPDYRMVVFAGQGHLMAGTGIPMDLGRELDTQTFSIIQTTASTPPDFADADYFVISEPLTLPPEIESE